MDRRFPAGRHLPARLPLPSLRSSLGDEQSFVSATCCPSLAETSKRHSPRRAVSLETCGCHFAVALWQRRSAHCEATSPSDWLGHGCELLIPNTSHSPINRHVVSLCVAAIFRAARESHANGSSSWLRTGVDDKGIRRTLIRTRETSTVRGIMNQPRSVTY